MHNTNIIISNVSFTGFPERVLFNAFYELVSPYLNIRTKLLRLAPIIMYFVKLRLNLFGEDIAHTFGVHPTTVPRNFHRILNIASAKTSFLIKWPERDVLHLTMPISSHHF